MIFDATLLFSDNQAITGDAASANVIDLGETGTIYGAADPMVRDIGKGTVIPLWVSVTEDFDELTSLTVQLQTDSADTFGSPKTVAQATYPLASLVAGAVLPFPNYVPEGVDERYFRLFYDVTGTDPTAGKITAGVVAARQTN